LTYQLAENEFKLNISTDKYLTNLSVLEATQENSTDDSPKQTDGDQTETAQRNLIYEKLDQLAEAVGEQVPEEEDVPKHWLRYPLLFMYVNCVVIISSLALCFSPTSTAIANAYGVGLQQVSMCGMSFTATYIPTTFLSMWLYKYLSPHNITRISCVIMLSGGWFRLLCVVNTTFLPVMIGEIWLSMACPLYFNMMTQFCNAWFPDSERTAVTALCGLSIPLGNLVAFTMSGFIYAGAQTDLDYQHATVKMIWIQNLWITFICVPYIIFLKTKPDDKDEVASDKKVVIEVSIVDE
jgi:hypothetical protein